MREIEERSIEDRLSMLLTNYGYLREKVEELERKDLDRKVDTVRAKIDELKERGSEAVDGAVQRAEQAWQDLEGAFERLKKRFPDSRS